MARFRGTVQGQRGEASRLGNAKTGLTVTANGWDCGVRVEAFARISSATGEPLDLFHIYATGGSNGGEQKLIATVTFNGRERAIEQVSPFAPIVGTVRA
jgi:hypothetical protein